MIVIPYAGNTLNFSGNSKCRAWSDNATEASGNKYAALILDARQSSSHNFNVLYDDFSTLKTLSFTSHLNVNILAVAIKIAYCLIGRNSSLTLPILHCELSK